MATKEKPYNRPKKEREHETREVTDLGAKLFEEVKHVGDMVERLQLIKLASNVELRDHIQGVIDKLHRTSTNVNMVRQDLVGYALRFHERAERMIAYIGEEPTKKEEKKS